MKKLILGLLIVSPLLLTSGCKVRNVSVTTGSYYTPGYYPGSPYWYGRRGVSVNYWRGGYGYRRW